MDRVWMIRVGKKPDYKPYYLDKVFRTRKEARDYTDLYGGCNSYWYVVQMGEKQND